MSVCFGLECGLGNAIEYGREQWRWSEQVARRCSKQAGSRRLPAADCGRRRYDRLIIASIVRYDHESGNENDGRRGCDPS